MTKEEKMAYIAGIIDGDGSLSLIKKQESASASCLYYPLVQFSKSTPIFSELLRDEFGGSVCCIDRTLNTHRTKREYRWKLEKATQCLPFLKSISPYLQNKSKQAVELIDFVEKNQFVRGKRLSDDDKINRDQKWLLIKNLNSNRDVSSRLMHTSTRSSKTSSLFWQYFSGLLDTDGSFSIKREKNGSYSPVLLLSSVNSNSINFIEKNCKKGSFFLVKAPKLKQKFYYRFGAYTKQDVFFILENVIPYLRHKKSAAIILKEFCEGYVAQGGRYKKTYEQLAFREDCYKRMIEANNGVYKPSLIILKPLTGSAEGNREQAGDEPCSLNEVSEKGLRNKVCGTLNSRGNLERRIRRGLPA